MSEQNQAIRGAATALPEDERALLVDALIGTLSPAESAGLDDAWLTVADRRSREIDAGSVALVSWADLKARAANGALRND